MKRFASAFIKNIRDEGDFIVILLILLTVIAILAAGFFGLLSIIGGTPLAATLVMIRGFMAAYWFSVACILFLIVLFTGLRDLI